MTKSPEIKNLAAALAVFQAEMQAVARKADNPFFKSKYADLASIIEAIRMPLAKNGLSFSQFPTLEHGLTTILMHSSGEWLEDTFFLHPVKPSPQDAGSALTYARRYALGAVLGISTEKDDDAKAASKGKADNGELSPEQALKMIEGQNDPAILREWQDKIEASDKYAAKTKTAIIASIKNKLGKLEAKSA